MANIKKFFGERDISRVRNTPAIEAYLKEEKRKVLERYYSGNVVDGGCGDGRSTRIIAQRSQRVSGIDFVPELVKKAISFKGPKENYLVMDLADLRYEDMSINHMFFLWNTLGNLDEKLGAALGEARRVLAPDGVIYASVLSENALIAYLDFLEQNNLKVDNYDEKHVYLNAGHISRRFSERDLIVLAKDAGLVAKVERLTDISYWCEMRKE